jgi:hypothetical protein
MKSRFILALIGVIVLVSIIAATPIRKDNRTLSSYTFTSGQVTCTVAGTKYPIPVEAESIAVRAMSANAGKVYLGDSTTATSSAGHELAAGESITLGGSGFYIGANTIYVTSAQNNDKISWCIVN